MTMYEKYRALGLPRPDGTADEAPRIAFEPVTFTFVKRE